MKGDTGFDPSNEGWRENAALHIFKFLLSQS
jgi:hypothetical protein